MSVKVTKEKGYCGMEEKRHHNRLKLDVSILLERLTEDGTDKYGATFIGMSDTDAIKIDIYQVFREA